MTNFKDFVNVREKYLVKYKRDSDKSFNELTVDDNQFLQAFKYMQVNEEAVTAALKKINSTGMDARAGQQILNIVMKYDNPINFFEALQEPMNVKEFLACGDVITHAVNKYKLEPKLVIELLQYQPATQPVTGKVEAFMCLFVEGARKGTKGDIFVNGKQFEVKGSGARIRGQAGFGSGAAAVRTFDMELQRLCRKAKLEFPLEHTDYTISPNLPGFIDELAPGLVSTGKVYKDDIVNVYANGFKEVYERADIQDIKAWVRRCIDTSGVMNTDFYPEYFHFALKYYIQREDFDFLVLVETGDGTKSRFGKINYISKKDILTNTGVTTKVIWKSWPSLRPNSSPQDSFFAIQPVVNVEI